jgi:hypothetical protein
MITAYAYRDPYAHAPELARLVFISDPSEAPAGVEVVKLVEERRWLPIETAPKDGTEIIGLYYRDWGDGTEPSTYGPWTIAFNARSRSWAASWSGDRVIESQGDWGTDYHVPDVQPNIWQPLPPPPTKDTK